MDTIPSLLFRALEYLLAMAVIRPASPPSPSKPYGVPFSASRKVNATQPPSSPAATPLTRSAGQRWAAAPRMITPATAITTGIMATRSWNGSAEPSMATAPKTSGRHAR